MARVKTGTPRTPKAKADPAELVKALARSAGRGIDSGGLLESLIECWGGREALARDIYAEFQAAKPASMGRVKILELFQRLVIVTTTQDLAKPRAPAEMDETELIEQATALLRRATHAEEAAAAGPEEEAGQGPGHPQDPAAADDPAGPAAD